MKFLASLPRIHALSIVAVVTCLAVTQGAASAQVAGTTRLRAPQALPQAPVASAELAKRIATNPRSAISLAAGDFFEDGRQGLVTGYRVGGGGVIAVQQGTALPRPDDFDTVGPFSTTSQFIDLGFAPDFLKSGDLNGDGHQDLIAAARGGNSFALLLGDGRGGFTQQAAIPVAGNIVSVAAWTGAGKSLAAVGVCGTSCAVNLYRADGTQLASVPVADQPSILISAGLNRPGYDDLIVGGTNSLQVIDGLSAGTGSPHLDTLPIAGAVAAATGSFVYDGRAALPQIAVLTADGSVHVLARTGLIATPPPSGDLANRNLRVRPARTPIDASALGWMDAETLAGVAVPDSGTLPLLVRSRISGNGMDDLVAMNVNGGATVSISHPLGRVARVEGQVTPQVEVLPAVVATELTGGDAVSATLPMRVAQTGGLGLVTATAQAQPLIARLTTKNTFYVGTSSDASPTGTVTKTTCESSSNTSCTLRQAISYANADYCTGGTTCTGSTSNADTIMIPSGIFTVTYSSSGTGVDGNGNYNYHIEVDAPVNIIGASTSGTILNANFLDKYFSFNPGYQYNQTVMDVFITNLTIENGLNRNSSAANANADPIGGAFDFDTLETGNMTLANVNFTGNTAEFGDGGAVYVSDNILSSGAGPFGTGTLEVDGGTFAMNKSSENGGAISTATAEGEGYVPLIINGATFNSNSVYNSGVDVNTYVGYGGAVDYAENPQAGTTSSIQNSTFTGNSSITVSGTQTPAAGGAVLAESGMTVSNSIFQNNSAATDGGGLALSFYDAASVVTGNTFTGNSAPDGSGVQIAARKYSNSPSTTTFAATIQYNRISNNTGSATRSGLGVGSSDGTTYNGQSIGTNGSVNANYNFWGCNGLATGSGCNTAAEVGTGGTFTLGIYAQVVATLNTNTPAPGGTLTLTGGITQDSNNAALANLNAFTGVTGGTSSTSSGVTVTNPGGTVSATLTLKQGSTTLATSTVAPPSTASVSITANALTSGGTGTGTIVIDNATATANFTVTVLSPTISIGFNPTSVQISGSSVLTFSLANPNTTVALNGVAFTDTLPAGLTVASVPNASSTCGGTLTAAANSGSISLSGSTINASSNCSISVTVTGTTAGAKNNTTGAITATNESASGATSNTATLTVIAQVTIGKAFGGSITAGGTTTLTFTLTNPAALSQTGIAFTDSFPAGLTIAAPSGLTGACGGAVSATAGTNSVSLSGGNLNSGANCTIVVNVTAPTPGTINNVTGAVSSTQGGTGGTASASLNVMAASTSISLSAPATADRGASATLTATFTILSGGPAPTQSVSFYSGSTLLGTGTLTSSSSTTYTATYSSSALPSGMLTLTAQYPTGDPIYPMATSSPQMTLVIANNAWIGNSNGTTSAEQATGAPLISGADTGGGTGVAIDSSGNVWSINSSGNSLAKFTNTGVVTSSGYTGGGLSSPAAVVVDGNGQVWIANGTGSVSVFTNSGTAVSSKAYVGGTGGNLSTPTGIAVDISGNLWVANSGSNTVTEILGAAYPTVSPLANGVATSTVAKEP